MLYIHMSWKGHLVVKEPDLQTHTFLYKSPRYLLLIFSLSVSKKKSSYCDRWNVIVVVVQKFNVAHHSKKRYQHQTKARDVTLKATFSQLCLFLHSAEPRYCINSLSQDRKIPFASVTCSSWHHDKMQLQDKRHNSESYSFGVMLLYSLFFLRRMMAPVRRALVPHALLLYYTSEKLPSAKLTNIYHDLG